LEPKSQSAEIAFLVQDKWQEKGMGSFLLEYLISIARQRGVKQFTARVLPVNKPMLNVFHNSGCPVSTEFDGDSYSIQLDIAGKTNG
ncbi:MAG TPA: GNAT family N-acetyltransferase, partial [Phycisphaerae bacterium]|nr:GNAT family N-acetyltransferase [Phycisphaerae bacterium]